MISIPRHKNFSTNEERFHALEDGYIQCVVCGKGLKEDKAKHLVQVYEGSYLISESDKANLIAEKTQEVYNSGDCGLYAVGTDCLKRHPEIKPYLIRGIVD